MRYVYEFWKRITEKSVPLAAVLTGISLFSFLSAALWLARAVRMARRKRKQEEMRRAEKERRLEYTLPQKGNGYIRERLQSSLQVEVGKESKQARVRLGYACALLGKVQGAPLTIAERLQAADMAEVFALCRGKEVWTAEELRRLNDLCGALLKLSAKYAV